MQALILLGRDRGPYLASTYLVAVEIQGTSSARQMQFGI